MADDIAISLTGVSKVFKRYHHPIDRLKEIFIPENQGAEVFWALRDVDLKILKGETVGIVGRNGSGKSTLLQIIAGTLQPTTGDVKVNGRVSALLELGSGFNPEFTGRQNVFFNGKILGLTQAEVESKFDEIAAFADIGDFIDEPVKTYSSGMFVRLGFAIAINAEPDILIIDEALSVGDGIFVHQCMAKIKDFQESGGTLLFVSHDIGSVTRLCKQAYWLKTGSVFQQDTAAEVGKSYQAWMLDAINVNTKRKQERKSIPSGVGAAASAEKIKANEPNESGDFDRKGNQNPFTNKPFLNYSNAKRAGSGRCEISHVEVLDSNRNRISFVMPSDEITIHIKAIAHDFVRNPMIGVQMFDRLRTAIVGWNTFQYDCPLPSLNHKQQIIVEFKMKWPSISGGSYILEPAVADGSQHSNETLDWVFATFKLEAGVQGLTFGIMKVEEVQVTSTIQDG